MDINKEITRINRLILVEQFIAGIGVVLSITALAIILLV